MEMILKTTNLCKSFGGQTAVNNISLNIERNSVYGLLGPNGAGKSTTDHIGIIVGGVLGYQGKLNASENLERLFMDVVKSSRKEG